MANWLAACFQVNGGHLPIFLDIAQGQVEQLAGRLVAGKWPRFLTILRNCMCMLSMALVV
jgi:hypothetical protein